MKSAVLGENALATITGETVEKVKMAILPIYESLKIKNLQTAKDHKMAISRVFRQSRKQHCIVAPLVAQKIGGLIGQESVRHTPKTEDFY